MRVYISVWPPLPLSSDFVPCDLTVSVTIVIGRPEQTALECMNHTLHRSTRLFILLSQTDLFLFAVSFFLPTFKGHVIWLMNAHAVS